VICEPCPLHAMAVHRGVGGLINLTYACPWLCVLCWPGAQSTGAAVLSEGRKCEASLVASCGITFMLGWEHPHATANSAILALAWKVVKTAASIQKTAIRCNG